MKRKKKVVLGMSGGVDSSVAAWRLKESGYEVIGLFMNNWVDGDDCNAADDFTDVRRVCMQLDIPYYSINLANEYKQQVFKNFLDEYKKGRTPNPDILCNREIKFGHFYEKAMGLGADYIATGHYARVRSIKGEYRLLKGRDISKDQSYFLYAINIDRLSKVLFPIGEMYKTKIREIAKSLGLATAEKKDSTGVCFIGPKDFHNFLGKYIPSTVGQIQTITGEIVGSHKGVIHYTLGQRHGLGIGGNKLHKGKPWFVVDKDMRKNVLIVDQGDSPELYQIGLVATNLNWLIPPGDLSPTFMCTAKCRYRQVDQDAQVTLNADGTCTVKFEKKQRAVTPGQSIVFYKDDICLGGGIINSTERAFE